jgi:hypothetical protein
LILFEDTDRRRKILQGIILSRNSATGASGYHRTGYFETTAFMRFFYGIRILSPSDLAAGNPWDALENDMKWTARERSSCLGRNFRKVPDRIGEEYSSPFMKS